MRSSKIKQNRSQMHCLREWGASESASHRHTLTFRKLPHGGLKNVMKLLRQATEPTLAEVIESASLLSEAVSGSSPETEVRHHIDAALGRWVLRRFRSRSIPAPASVEVCQ